MPYATSTFTADGGATYGPLAFTVITSDEVTATVDGISTTAFTYDAVGNQITFDAPPAVGVAIVVSRATKINTPRVEFENGSPILANDLNVNTDQLLNAIQDLADSDANTDAQVEQNTQDIDQLEADLATETSIRISADVTLQNNINAEESARQAADASEANTRAAADSALQANIDNEASIRIGADVTLQNNIDAEESSRISADTGILSVVADNNQEIQFNTINITALDTRVTDLESEDTNIDGRLDTLESEMNAVETVAADAATEAGQNTTRNDQQDLTINGIGGIAGQAVSDAAAAQTTADTAQGIALSNSSALSTLGVFTGQVNPALAGVQDVVSGYRSIVTPYYDPGTTNTVQNLTANVWNILMPDVYLDEQREIDTMVAQDTYVASQGRWYLAGTQPGTHCLARVLYQVTPDEDESEFDIRLNFVTNPATIATGLFQFQVEAIGTVMSQGADIPYTDEVLISFFVGDTLFGPTQADCGSFVVEAKSSVASEVEVLSVTLNTHY